MCSSLLFIPLSGALWEACPTAAAIVCGTAANTAGWQICDSVSDFLNYVRNALTCNNILILVSI
jgi:hypothetical protein